MFSQLVRQALSRLHTACLRALHLDFHGIKHHFYTSDLPLPDSRAGRTRPLNVRETPKPNYRTPSLPGSHSTWTSIEATQEGTKRHGAGGEPSTLYRTEPFIAPLSPLLAPSPPREQIAPHTKTQTGERVKKNIQPQLSLLGKREPDSRNFSGHR